MKPFCICPACLHIPSGGLCHRICDLRRAGIQTDWNTGILDSRRRFVKTHWFRRLKHFDVVGRPDRFECLLFRGSVGVIKRVFDWLRYLLLQRELCLQLNSCQTACQRLFGWPFDREYASKLSQANKPRTEQAEPSGFGNFQKQLKRVECCGRCFCSGMPR